MDGLSQYCICGSSNLSATKHGRDCLEHMGPNLYRLLNQAYDTIAEMHMEKEKLVEKIEAEERWKIQNGRELPEEIIFPLYRSPQELAPHIGVSVGGLFDTHATARYVLEGTNLEVDGNSIGAAS